MIEHLEKNHFSAFCGCIFFFFFKLSYILGSRVQASAQIIMSENLHLAHDEGDKMMGIGKEKIESFIKKRGDIIELNGKSNEEAAKQSLILPMLRELGYATDSLEVFPEYATNEQYYSNKGAKCCVDYAIFLNGKPYTKSYIMYNDIMKGGTLELQMGSQPSKWGTRPADRP